jgi:predicted PurR-regulated permease PerM
MLQEIEFEWINQFYVQGTRYHAIHSWWNEPMRQLVEYWIELNKRTLSVMAILKLAAGRTLLLLILFSHETAIVSSNWITDLSALENKEKKRILKLRKKLEAVEVESYDALSQSLLEVP